MAIYRNSTAKNQAVLNRLNNMRYSQLLKQKQYNNALVEERQIAMSENTTQPKKSNAGFLERVVETGGDFVGNVLSGAVKGLEGIYDFGASIVGGVGGIFDKDFQDRVKDHVAYDFTGNNVTNPLNELFNDSYLNDSKIGNFVENVASGVGQMLPSVAMNIVLPGSGMVTMGLSATGTGTEQAFNDGASYGQGMLYGAISGATEMATEKLGGKLFGNTSIDTALGIKPSSKTLFKGATTKLGKVVQDAISEGVEEGVAELVNPLTKTIYKGTESLKEYGDGEFWKGVGESALVGAATSAAFGGTIGRINRNTNNANEILSELKTLDMKEENLHASNELFEGNNQSKIDNLRNKLRAELSESVVKMNEKTRSKYIQQNHLESILNADGTLKPLMVNSAQDTETTSKGAKNGLASDVNRYMSVGLKGQEQNISERLKTQGVDIYKGKLTKAEQDNYTRFKKTMLALSRKGLVKSNFVIADKSTKFDAYLDGNMVVIGKNMLESDEWQRKVIHEVEHFTEGSKEWFEFADFVMSETNLDKANQDILSKKYGITQEDIDTLDENLKNNKVTDKQRLYISEVIATQTEFLFGNEQSIARLTATKKSLAQKILDKIKDFIKVLKAKTPNEKNFIKKLQQAESLFEKALSKAGTDYLIKQSIDANKNIDYNNETKFARKTATYIPYDKVGNDNIDAIRQSLTNIYGNLDNCVADGIAIENGNTIYVVDSGKENGEIRFGIRNTIKISDETLRKERMVKINDRAIQDGFISEQLSGKIRGSSDKHSRGSIGQQLQKELSANSRESTNNKERVLEQNADKRGIKYSLSKDSDANTLTETQVEYFKDSKVRDENGNLLVCYHGTDSKFTEFDPSFIGDDNKLGLGFYFTRGKELKFDYDNKIKAYINIKNPIYDNNPMLDDILVREESLRKEGYTQEQVLNKIYKEFGYDGIIAKHNRDAVVAFFPNQIKETTNIRPTFNNDIRYALSKDTDVNKLVAIHNISEQKLLDSINLGGLAVPSIAIINAEHGHTNFGDISLVFKKDTIDPTNNLNKVYDADVYSKRFPQVVSRMTDKSFDKFKEIFDKSIEKFKPALSSVFEDLNEVPKRQALERLEDVWYFTKDQFLQENGVNLEIPMMEVKNAGGIDTQYVIEFAKQHPEITQEDLPFEQIESMREEIKSVFDKYYQTKQTTLHLNRTLSLADLDRFVGAVARFNKNPKSFTIIDSDKLMKDIDSKIKEIGIEKYRNWLRDILTDLYGENSYFRNDRDVFDYYGNRRSFNQLYNVYNLENIVQYMVGNVRNEEGFNYGAGNIRSLLAKQYKTIEDIKVDLNKLVSSKDLLLLKSTSEQALYTLAENIVNEVGGNSDNRFESINIATDLLVDIAKTNLSDISINRQFKEYGRKEPSVELREEIKQYMQQLKDMPTEYFEAKPQRVVEFNEVVKVFAPEKTNQQIVEFFENKGIEVQLYGENTPTRTELVKTLPQEIKFALSKGQVAKDRANNSKMKVYSRIEAEKLINEIVADKLNIENKFGVIRGKNKQQAINQMFIALNSADAGYRTGLAQNIADFIIENAIYEDMFDDGMSEELMRQMDVIKQYRGKLDLSSIKGEIQYKYDIKPGNAIIMNWGTTKGGFGVDTVAQELIEEGINIDAINEADIFFQMLDTYNNARDTLKQKSQKIRADYFDSGELKNLKNELVREILKGYDKYGTESKFAGLIKKYVDRISLLKETIKDLKGRNKAINNLFATIDKVNGLEKFKSADIELSNEVLGLIKLLKKVKTYRGNLSKNVREIMLQYSSEVDGKKLYDLIANNGDGIENPVAKMVEDIAHANGELTTNEIRQLDDIMKNFIHNVKEYNRVFFEGKTQNDEEIVKQAIKETRDAISLKTNGFLGSMAKSVRWLTAPVWRFERLSSYRQNGIMTRVFGELQQGVDNQAKFNMIVAEHFKEFFKENKKVVQDWNKQTFDLNGTKISRGQAITLYMLFQRKQAVGHLLANDGITGTIRITNEKHASKGNFKDALAEGVDVQIDYSTLDTIKNSLSDTEKEFIKLSKEFFDKISKDAKYETDMALYGISNVGEENYIPIRVADDQIYKQLGGNDISFAELFSVYNASFNKETKPNAKNKIVVENILDVINRHSRQMASYYGLAVPLKTLNRLYNKKLDDGSKLSIEINKVDPEFERYLSKLLGDLQGRGNPRTTFDKIIGKIRGLGAKAALGLNLKVLANQFVSLPASHAVGVEYKHIMKGLGQAMSKKTDYAKLTEYCPMLYERFREGSNIDVGLLKEGQGVFSKVDALTDLTTQPIGKIDKFICGAVWNACLEQTKSNKYEDYSDEHYKEAAKLTEKAVIKTQSNYTALYRPAILREQNSFLQLSTMFMSEPLQQLSLLASSIDKIYVAKQLIKQNNSQENQDLLKQAKLEAKTAITAVTLDMVLLTLIAQAFKWIKGQDDEEDVLTSMTQEFTSNFIGMFPFIKDLYTMYQGYDVTNMAYTGLTNIYNAFSEMYNIVDLVATGKQYTDTEIRGKLRKVLLGLSQTFGIPLRNLETYTKGFIEKISPSAVYKYESLFYNNSMSNYSKELKKAIENDDDALADTIINVMLADEKVEVKDEKIRATMRELFEEGLDVFPRSVSETIIHDGESITLTKRQYENFKQIYSQANDKVSSLINTKGFEDSPSVVKAKSIKYIYDYYYEEALKDLLGIDSDAKKYLFAQAIDITKLAMIVSQVSQIEADVDKNGKAISGSRKEKIIALLNSMNLTAVQKYMLMGYFGYKNTNGERQVKTYIQSLKLTKTEKETLLSMCGY